MAPILSLIIALTLGFAAAANAGQHTRNLLDPAQVSSPPTGPTSTTLPFEVAWPVTCPCTLHVVNGAPGRGPLSPTRVIAGRVWVDGTLVLRPLQISSFTASASATLKLSPGAHDVRVEVMGLSASFLTVRVTGTITTANLDTARANHSATVMPNGSVIVAGGNGASGLLDSTERITAGANGVSPASPLLTPRAGHSAALVPGRAVVFAGGRDQTGDLASVEVWTTSGGAVAGLPLDEMRRAHTATTLIDGRVLILGGRNANGESVNTGVIIDPRPDAFTDGTFDATAGSNSILGSVLQVPRAGHTATLLADGRVLIIGGRNGTTDLSSIEVVDPAAGTSTLLPISLATARTNHTATLRSNGNILVIGGRNGSRVLASIERVRPSLAVVEPLGTINLARAGHTASSIRNGEILIAGGTTGSGPTARTELGPKPPVDQTPPVIVATSPRLDASDVDRGVVVGIHLSEPLDPSTVNGRSIELRNSAGTVIASSIGISDQGSLIAIRPDALLSGGTYTVTADGVTDREGLALPAFSFSFSVVPAPIITALIPTESAAGIEVTVTGSGFGDDPDDHRLSFGPTLIPAIPVNANTLRFIVPSMPLGSYPVSLRTRGGVATAPTAFQIVNPAPLLTDIAPSTVPAGSPAVTLTLSGTNFVDGATVVVGTTTLPATFVSSTSLQAEVPAALAAVAATLQVHVVNPAPGGGASNDLTLTVQSSGPTLTAVAIFPRGMSLSAGGSQQFTAEARYSDGAEVDVTNTAAWTSTTGAVTVNASGLASAAGEGTSTITVSFGGRSADAGVRVYAGESIPPDPADVAPELNPSESTPMTESTRFLYEGDNPIQRNVQPGAIEMRLVSVIRGMAKTRDEQPVSGVRVTIKDRDDLGHTLTRLDGMFDMAINGGGSVVVEFAKPGFLPLERRVAVPAGDIYPVQDVVLIALDPQVTDIDLNSAAPIQVARGSVVTDDDGSRQATILFPQGTSAEMRMPDGSVQPLTALGVRATEYTVGANGPAAMPGTLPISSAYTHAVELSVDEAIAAGATSVEFDRAVPVYYENFLGFPIGAAVPTGYYDRVKSTWVPSDNGVVLKILSVDGSGRAELDLDGDTLADDTTQLAAFGITDAERTTLAGTYGAGQSLWRVMVRHFTPWDHNWPKTLPEGAEASDQQPQKNEKSDEPAKCNGSIIECQDQVLGEQIALTGTGFSLNYRSDRVPGYTASDSFVIPLTGGTILPSLVRIDLTVKIAGQVFKQSFAPAPGLTFEYTWNRHDVYGRPVHGSKVAFVTVAHVYPVLYTPRPVLARPFQFGQLPLDEVAPNMFRVPGRELESMDATFTIELGPPPHESSSVAGWSLSPHHVYDRESRTLYYGHGGRRKVDASQAALPVELLDQLPEFEYLNAVAAKDGIYYVKSDGGARKVFRQSGTTPPVVVGTIGAEHPLAVDDQGIVYFAHCTAGVPGGVSLSRIVSGVNAVIASAVLPGGDSCNNFSLDLARAPDGTIYVSENEALLQMSPDGALEVAGRFADPAESIAVARDGTLYRSVYAVEGGMAIERVTGAGTADRVAGSGFEGEGGDGGPALDAEFGFLYDFAVAADGSLMAADFGFNDEYDLIRLRRVSPDGLIQTLAGGNVLDSALALPTGTPATAIGYIQHVDVGPDGWIYVFGHHSYRFAPDFDLSRTMTIASEGGSQIFEFTAAGRHLRTINAMTGADRDTFTYDIAGRLTAITDGDGLVTEVQRNGAGTPTAIVAPFGQTTTFSSSNGWLATVLAPGSRLTTLTTTPTGLLTALRNPRNEVHQFDYDAKGRLVRDEDPAGGSQTLGRTAGLDGWVATKTSAMGRVTSFETATLEENGAQRLTITAPDGTSSIITSHQDGSQETLASDGTRTVTTLTPDPRFGLHVPIPLSSTITTPAGLTLSTRMERWVEFESSQDYSTLLQWDYTFVNGRMYETFFDGSTRTYTTTTPAGRISSSTIDVQGRVTRTQVGSLAPIEYVYDALGRHIETRQGVRRSTIAYDAAGRPSVLGDALLRNVSFGYDAADRVVTQTLPDTRTIGFGYDTNSNVTSLAPPGRPAHTFTHTPIDLTASYTPPMVPGTGPTGYVFNPDRQPTEVQRPDGQTTLFSYGATDARLASVLFSRGTSSYGYDAAGRLSSLADPGGVNLAFTYDGALPLSETWSGPIEGAVSRTFTPTFDLATEKVNGAFEVAFGYDDDRLLTAAGALTVTRHPANGLVTGTTLGSTIESHEYNEFGEPIRQTAALGGTHLFDVQTTRDDLGRITQRIEVVDGITRLFQYGYDLAGRLRTVTRNGDLVVLYSYDANGNRLTAEGEAGLIAGTYDDQDRLLTYGAATYTYTATGELATKAVAGQTTSYVYDTLGNLIQVTKPNGDVIAYTVDGRGRRVGKSINGVRVKGWLYADQLRPIAELDADGEVVSRLVYGTRANVPDYLTRGGITYRIVSDHLGSPRVIVNASTGDVVQRMDFQPFGEIIQDSAPGWQLFGFAGGIYDPDTGLIRFGVRDYDPQSGRWLAKDPIGFGGGASNVYSYAANDSINKVDPTGLIIAHPGDLLDWAAFAVDLVSFLGCPGGSTGRALALSTVGLLPLVSGLGWLDDAAEGAGRAVIGENMTRVREAAEKLGADIFTGETMAENLAWIQEKVKQGAEIIDIGPDWARRAQRQANGETPWSPFYNLERMATKAYDKYVKSFTRP